MPISKMRGFEREFNRLFPLQRNISLVCLSTINFVALDWKRGAYSRELHSPGGIMPQNLLEQLRSFTVVVADTGDIEAMEQFRP